MPTTTGVATSFIDFTRASNATVTDSDGKVKWAPHNLLTNSESFDAAGWTKSSVTPTANSIAAPNGTTTADTLAASGANGTTLQTFTAEAISYTFGVWLKRKTGTGNIQIAADSGTYTTVTITSDWALYTVTQTPAAGSKSAGIRIVTSADEVYAWGASLYRSDLAMQPNTSAYTLYNPTTPKNLLGYTESLTTGWTNSNTTDAIVSEVNPVGLTGAVDVAATAGNGTLLGSLSLLASPYTFSIWLKRKTGGGTVEITIDGTTYVAAAVTGTWTRFSTTLTPSAGTKTPGIRLVTSGDAVYAWGAQLSDSASLDSYVPVYGAAVTSAAYYGPRRDFDGATLACKGLLVEEQRSNLILYSAQFDVSANWTPSAGVSFSANSTISPDGTLTADTMISSAGNQIDQSISCSTSTVYTNSLYFKKTSGAAYQPALYLLFSGGTLVIYAVRLNTDTGVATAVSAGGFTAPSSFAVQDVGQYWRLSITGNSNNNTTVSFRLYPNLAAGGGVGGAGSQIIWGAQLEANAPFATSYIPVGATSAGATRNADVASVSTQAFPYLQGTGTIVANNQSLSQMAGSFMSVASLASGLDESNLASVGYQTSGATTRMLVINTGSSQADLSPSGASASMPNKLGLAFATNDFSAVVNGGTAATDPTGSAPVATGLFMGASSAQGISRFNGHIRQITYLPRRISNTELQQRTSA